MSTSIIIEISKIRAASMAMADKDFRYYLCGVLFEHNGAETRVVGCDGHRLHACRIEHDNLLVAPVSFIMPAAMVKTIIKAKAPRTVKYPTVSITLEGTTIEARLPDGTSISAQAIDGRFPDYRRVIPTTAPSGEPAVYNPDYLRDAMQAFNVANGHKADAYNTSLGMQCNGNDAGYIAAPGFVATVMPLRLERSLSPALEFVAELQKPESIGD